jgi:hypothetical protein
MADFDIAGARAAGYSDAEIRQHLSSKGWAPEQVERLFARAPQPQRRGGLLDDVPTEVKILSLINPESGLKAAIDYRSNQNKFDEEKQRAELARQKALDRARIVIAKVDEALKQTGPLTTGLPGKVLGRYSGTSAYDLDRTLDPIRANIGFKELQDMRAVSPTGGALGQVAIKELEFLQASIASLDQGQSREQLENNLKDIKRHFKNWKMVTDAASKGYIRIGTDEKGRRVGMRSDGTIEVIR